LSLQSILASFSCLFNDLCSLFFSNYQGLQRSWVVRF